MDIQEKVSKYVLNKMGLRIDINYYHVDNPYVYIDTAGQLHCYDTTVQYGVNILLV